MKVFSKGKKRNGVENAGDTGKVIRHIELNIQVIYSCNE